MNKHHKEKMEVGDRVCNSYTSELLGRIQSIREDESEGGKIVMYYAFEDGREFSAPECVFSPTPEEFNKRCVDILKARLVGRYAGDTEMRQGDIESAELALRIRIGSVAASEFIASLGLKPDVSSGIASRRMAMKRSQVGVWSGERQ